MKIKYYIKYLFATMRTGISRIKACFRSQCVVYFQSAQITLFILHTHIKSSGCVFAICRKKISYLERQSLIRGGVFPIFLGPLPEFSQLPLRPLHFPYPSHPLPSDRAFILHKDDINKPDSSVGHSTLHVIHITQRPTYVKRLSKKTNPRSLQA